MPADKMVSYPMQNNGSLDEKAFFFGTRFRTLRCAKGFALWKPTNFCVQKLDKKLLFCTVGRLLLYFLRKYKRRICLRVYHAKKAQHGAVLFWRGESIKKGSGKRNEFFLSEHITLEKAKKQHLNCKVQNFFTNLRKVLLWKNWFGCVMIENIRSIERGNGHEFSAEKGKAAQHAVGRKPAAECNRNCKGIWCQPPDHRRGCGTSAGSRREHRGDPAGICFTERTQQPHQNDCLPPQ